MKKFSEEDTNITDTSYISKNVCINVYTYSEDNLTFYVQDIYIKNISSLKTAFAQDTYGKSITEWPLDMAINNNAIAAVNGDYYGIHSDGVVIRNGYVYRTDKDPDDDVCVIYWDGVMKTFSSSEFNVDDAISDGAYQAWSFGPALIDNNGIVITEFNSSVNKANPRTAIGYYEPGHYCFVSVDGRNENGSSGLTLAALAQLMKDLGCNAAYNLDGGKSSAMIFNDQLVNSPTGGGREDTDIIYICE